MMKDGIVLDQNDVKQIIAEHFNVPVESVIKAQYSYIVVDGKEESPSK